MFDNYTRVTAKNSRSASSGLCTCLHANMYRMDDEVRGDWPLGPELRRHRENAGLSQREASRRTTPPGSTKPAVSAGRWKQLETGWQKNKGALIPIGTTAATVAAAARAVRWDVNEALATAGFRSEDVPTQPAEPVIARYSDDELLAEIRRRMRGARHGVEDQTKSSTSPEGDETEEDVPPSGDSESAPFGGFGGAWPGEEPREHGTNDTD